MNKKKIKELKLYREFLLNLKKQLAFEKVNLNNYLDTKEKDKVKIKKKKR